MKSEAMWDRLARDWDTPDAKPGQGDVLLIEKAKQYLTPNASVLDFGCATGSVALELAAVAQNVHGLDISSQMVAVARRRASERGVSNAAFTHGTIFDQQLEPESFDVILAFNILHLVDHPAEAVSRIHQLLKPGGVLIAATPCLGERKVVSLLLNLPVFLLSKVGVLPRVSFFSMAGLTTTITNAHLQMVETELLAMRPVTESLIVARRS